MSEHLPFLKNNIESVNRLTTVSQRVAHEKEMNRYHAAVITMLHQMVQNQILLLKIVQKSSAKPAP